MAEPVLPTVVIEGQSGALVNWQVLNAFHNNWIHSAGQRVYMPADFVFSNVGAGNDTTTNKAAIVDTSTISTANFQMQSVHINDKRTWSANQTVFGGATEGNSALKLTLDPVFAGVNRQLSEYSALTIYSVAMSQAPFAPAGLSIGSWNAIAIHFDNVVGANHGLMMGFAGHMGAILGTVGDMRTVNCTFNLLFGGAITKATGFFVEQSQAQRTWGYHVGGRNADATDAYPSYHMGPIAMGGVPTTNSTGAEFDPYYMLDVREVRQLVRTVLCTTVAGQPTLTAAVGGQGTQYPPNLFDFPTDMGAAVSGTGIPTTSIVISSPGLATMGANATQTFAPPASTTITVTKPLADQYASALSMVPGYNGAVTVARHNYIRVVQPNLTGGAAVTTACVFEFNVAAGTHKALDTGTTKTTPGAVTAWLKCNIAGTVHFIPMYASKTT